MSATTDRQHVVTYPAAVMRRACELREAGWTLRQVAAMIAEETGATPTDMTVLRWTNEKWDEREKARARERRAAQASVRASFALTSPEFKLARMRAIHDRGVSCQAIAAVMALDFGDDLTAGQVRHALAVGRYPGRKPGRPKAAA